MKKKQKIDAAIADIKLKIKKCEQEIMLLTREKKVLKEQLDTLIIINDNERYE